MKKILIIHGKPLFKCFKLVNILFCYINIFLIMKK